MTLLRRLDDALALLLDGLAATVRRLWKEA